MIMITATRNIMVTVMMITMTAAMTVMIMTIAMTTTLTATQPFTPSPPFLRYCMRKRVWEAVDSAISGEAKYLVHHLLALNPEERISVSARLFTITMNPDVSTGPPARPIAGSLALLTHSLAPPCSLRSRTPLPSFVCLRAHSFAPSHYCAHCMGADSLPRRDFHPGAHSSITPSFRRHSLVGK